MYRGGDKNFSYIDELTNLLPDIYRFAFYLTGHHHDAEDVVQNVCIKFLKYGKSYDPRKGGLRFYLQRLTVNESKTLFSKKKQHGEIREVPESLSALHPDTSSLDIKDSADIILSLLDDLTSREREIFVMREVLEMEYDVVADLLGISNVTVRRFYSISRKKLREQLKARYPEYTSLLTEE